MTGATSVETGVENQTSDWRVLLLGKKGWVAFAAFAAMYLYAILPEASGTTEIGMFAVACLVAAYIGVLFWKAVFQGIGVIESR